MVKLNTNQHVFCAGKTQSGKSVLIKSFINQMVRVVYHDRKCENGDFAKRNHYYVVKTPVQLHKLLQKGAKRVMYQPTDPGVEDFNRVCHIVYTFGNMNFIIDEAASYCSTGRVPFWTSELLRLGSGRGIGVISLSQRPRSVDNVLLSESTIIISFRLALATDRMKIAETCGKIVDPKLPEDPKERAKTKSLATLNKYNFMVFNGNTDVVTWHKPIKVAPERKV